MKYQEKYYVPKDDCLDNIKSITSKLILGTLEIENKKVDIPDKELEYKVKYEEDEEGGQFVIKVTWSSEVEKEEDEEE